MVAMLLTSIMVTSVFSVTLTVKTGGSKGERKLKAAAATKQIATQLKNYVTGDPLSTTILGPGTGAGAASWSMDTGGIDDTSCVNCYALTPGSHTLTGVMPASFEDVPYNARVTYFISTTDTVNGRPVPSVSITTTWDDP
jgi:hypothetical protein